jgi:predicted peptidase
MRLVLFLLWSVFSIGSLHADERSRTWTASDGRTLEGQYLRSTAQSTSLRLKGGKVVDIALEKLSAADREHIATLVQRQAIAAQRSDGLRKGPYAALVTTAWEKAKSEDGLEFHFYASKKLKPTETYPLCIYLHGASNVGSHLTKREPGADGFMEANLYKEHPSIIIAPEVPEKGGGFGEIAPRIITLIQHLSDHLPIDRDRIYVTGYSMGSHGTFSLLKTAPDLFAAAAPIAGAPGTDVVPKLPKTPLWLHWGENDEAERFRALAAALKSAGHPALKETEHPGAGHTDFHWKVAKDPALYEWLFAQKRTPDPAS